jgi:hypothetical protein
MWILHRVIWGRLLVVVVDRNYGICGGMPAKTVEACLKIREFNR